MIDVASQPALRALEPLVDAPAAWEQPIPRPGRDVPAAPERPFIPLDRDEIPAGAAAALEPACGAWRLDQLLAVPPGTRRLVGQDAMVTTPLQVLAISDTGVGLWVDAPATAGVRACLAPDELAAIEHVQTLHHARLTFIADARSFAVRYGVTARHEVERQLTALRAAAGGYPRPVPGKPGTVPARWAHVVRSAVVSLDPGEPTHVVAHAPGDGRSTLVALTPREWIIARDPDPAALGGMPAYGPDTLHVPRRALSHIRPTPTGVRVRAAGCEVDVVLPAKLAKDVLALWRELR